MMYEIEYEFIKEDKEKNRCEVMLDEVEEEPSPKDSSEGLNPVVASKSLESKPIKPKKPPKRASTTGNNLNSGLHGDENSDVRSLENVAVVDDDDFGMVNIVLDDCGDKPRDGGISADNSKRVESTESVFTVPSMVEGEMKALLFKTNKDGKRVQCLFRLNSETLSYIDSFAATMTDGFGSALSDSLVKSVPLDSLIVMDIAQLDTESYFTERRTFAVLSKSKSFYIHATTDREMMDWFSAIDIRSRTIQLAKFGRVLNSFELIPLRRNKGDITACECCQGSFGIFSRKNFCRNCGKCVCDSCSRDRVRVPRLDEKALFKVCLDCATLLRNTREYGVNKT